MIDQVFLVTRWRGPRWDDSRTMEEQEEWVAHAQFMNALESDGFVALGGPIVGTPDALLVVRARDEAEIEDRLAAEIVSMGEDKTARARRADETIAATLRGGATPPAPFWTSQTLSIWLLQVTRTSCSARGRSRSWRTAHHGAAMHNRGSRRTAASPVAHKVVRHRRLLRYPERAETCRTRAPRFRQLALKPRLLPGVAHGGARASSPGRPDAVGYRVGRGPTARFR